MNHCQKTERYNINYDSKRRFISYWHQIHEAILKRPKNILEVGIGNGFVSDYLKKYGIKLTTLDINKELRPDYVASVVKMPFNDNVFELVMACEVLEHLPYRQFMSGLKEIHRVCSNWAIISLPDATRAFRVEFPIPKIGKFKRLFVIPSLQPAAHKMGEEKHYWEIGKRHYPLRRIQKDIQNAGFIIERTYRVFENPYHRFFILKKHQ